MAAALIFLAVLLLFLGLTGRGAEFWQVIAA